jgi:hypothetical protein
MSAFKTPKTHIKRHLWLPMIMAIFLIKGKVARAQDSGAIDYDQECGMYLLVPPVRNVMKPH